MATTQAAAASPVLEPYRITVKQYLKMIEADVFPDGAHMELLGGRLVETATSTPHDFIVDQLADLIRCMLPAGMTLREEKSLQLDRYSRPQPDIAVLRGEKVAFAHRDPQAS